MSLSDFVVFVMAEISIFDADMQGWTAMREYFETEPDADNHTNKGLIATIEERIGNLSTRRNQLTDMLAQISGLEEVTAW